MMLDGRFFFTTPDGLNTPGPLKGIFLLKTHSGRIFVSLVNSEVLPVVGLKVEAKRDANAEPAE